MNLYLLNGDPKGWDVAEGFVVRAKDEGEARKLAARHAGGEGPAFWYNTILTTCELLTDAGPSGVILRDYTRG